MRRSFFAALLTVGACGCSGLSAVTDAINPFAESLTIADERNPAVEVAGIWQPGEGRNAAGIPSRGFAGQVFFFTERAPEPALVNGTVRVYLFADRGTPEDRAKPIQQFDFTPEAWQTHATMTSLGPGYSVFVPYPKVEPHQVRCQLRVRFTPADGGAPVWSEAVTMVLDGPPQPGAEPTWWANADRSPPSVARHEISRRSGPAADLAGAEAEGSPRRALRTDTFSLGEVQPISYEQPASLPSSRAQSRGRHILDEAGTHPLNSRSVIPRRGTTRTRAATHPFEAQAEAHPAEFAPETSRRAFGLEDATPVSARSRSNGSGADEFTPASPQSFGASVHPLAE
jgi:hypothetical protein